MVCLQLLILFSTGSKFLIIKELDLKIFNNKDLRAIFGHFTPLSAPPQAERGCEGAAKQGAKSRRPGDGDHALPPLPSRPVPETESLSFDP